MSAPIVKRTILAPITGGIATPDRLAATTLPAMNTGNNHKGPKVWTPIYDGEHRLSLPIAWQCPCGGLAQTETGQRSCSKCGRIARDTPTKKLDGYQSMDTGRELKSWRKYGKRGGR